MKIYTKTGDEGQTGLFGGQRVSKASLRIEAYGVVDELNSILGTVRAQLAASVHPDAELDETLALIQNDLFVLGADLATPLRAPGDEPTGWVPPRIEASHVARIESAIDRADGELPPLKHFILPGGTLAAGALHHARTVCRTAERRTVALAQEEPIGEQPVIYLNRLSDLLFTLARLTNERSGIDEVEWRVRS